MRLVLLGALVLTGAVTADDKKAAPGDGRKALQGTWTIVSMERGGKKAEKPGASTVVFEGETYKILDGDTVVEGGMFSADARQTPNVINVSATTGADKGTKWHGVYELEGDTLRAVVGPTDKARPKMLAEAPEGTRGFTLKRAKPVKP